MTVEYGEYEGHPTIALVDDESSVTLRFGLTKAKLILKYIKEIEDFVDENE